MRYTTAGKLTAPTLTAEAREMELRATYGGMASGTLTVLVSISSASISSSTPVLFPRIDSMAVGLHFHQLRLTAPALVANELPKIDLIVLSHAQFRSLDLRTLHRV